MPTVTLNKEVFEKLVGKKLPLDQLKDRISMLGTDLEKIEGNEIVVEIFPNRPDMLSEQGFARAFSSFIGVKTGLRKYKVESLNEKLYAENLPKQWPYAVACVVKNLRFNDERIREVIQLQEKLGDTFTRNREKGGIGLYPLEKIRFPVKFTGMLPEKIKFRPLEFPSEMDARQILSKHPKGRDYCHLMENWQTYPVFIDSNKTFMSMPPIINSHEVGKIDVTTRDVFIECTGPDLNIIKTSLYILATSLAEMGGQIYSLEIIYPNIKFEFPDFKLRKIKINRDYINKLLGLKINEKEIKKYLERMGFGYGKGHVIVPSYRADILHQVDIAEDIAIAYGYENFQEEIPNLMTIGEGSDFENFKEKIADIMVGIGFNEVISYHITSKEKQTTKMNTKLDIIEIANSVSSEHNSVRSWILPNLLEILSNNKHNEMPQNIFDMGVVFKKDLKEEVNVKEATRLAVAICNEKSDFTQIKQTFDYLLSMLDIKYEIESAEHESFINGRVGRVKCQGRKIAFIGEISPIVLENWQLEYPVACFELNLTELFQVLSEKYK